MKITKTNDGFVKALDGFGDTWIYKENGWNSTIEIISDKFGNTFQLDTKSSCNEKQGYYILLNGKQNGCCKTLTLNEEGLVEAVDGFGERWLFKDQIWIKQ